MMMAPAEKRQNRTRGRLDGAGAEAGADNRLGGHRGLGGVPEAARGAGHRTRARREVGLPCTEHRR